MCWSRWLLSIGALLACFDAVPAEVQPLPEATSSSKTYETLVWKVFNGGPSALQDYLRLDQLFETLVPQDQRRLAQLQATADTIYGNYALAEQRHALAFPERKRSSCPTKAWPQPADRTILNMTEHADVVLFNELHTLVFARAYFLSLLMSLRQQGYDTLALEALYPATQSTPTPSNGLPKADSEIDHRGMVLDTGLGGVYTREPIYAELIRQAYRLGFHIIAYDALDAETRDAREAAQAKVLAEVASRPGSRMLVLAGGSHVWKSEGWMAQHLLLALPGKRVVSIDLASGYQGCETAGGERVPADRVAPVAMTDSAGFPWSDYPERTDLKIFMNATSDRTAWASWMYEPRAAFPIKVDTRLCGRKFPCLIEARRVGDWPHAVPADRTLMRAENIDSLLYLGLGEYVISIGDAHRMRNFLLTVSPNRQ